MGISRYRLPDGVEVESEWWCRCPSCRQLFRMHGDDYIVLPENLSLTCPHCRFSADHGEFITAQQLERA